MISSRSRNMIYRVDRLVRRFVGPLADSARGQFMFIRALARLKLSVAKRPHELPGRLLVSLTSYPPRFPTLFPTLVRVLAQGVEADHVILWIAHADMALLPNKVKRLARKGLQIRATDDLGPYKKIIPALQAFPDAFIVTADDDVDYECDWLERLLVAWNGQPNQIVFHRGHEILMTEGGMPRAYKEWSFRVSGPRESEMFFPTGAGGVLYPPCCLARNVLLVSEFMTHCPRADDLWLYWMGRGAGAVYKKTAGRNDVRMGTDSQKVALWNENLEYGANDRYISALIDRYGWPPKAR